MSSVDLQLSVIWPDEEGARPRTAAGGLSSAMTLSDFFWRYAWPDCLAPRGDSLRTRQDYETSLRYWQVFTGDPPLAEISQRTCSAFVRVLASSRRVRDDRQLAANTVHKHWVNIERLLRWTGPPSRQNREGTGLLAEPPWISPPRKERAASRPAFRLDELRTWLDGLPGVARLPARMARFDPAAWWRAVIVADYNTGLPPGTLFRLHWEQLEGPRVRPLARQCKPGRNLIGWLNTAALTALEPLRAPSGLIFGWADWPAAETTFGKLLHRQQQALGIRTLGLYALRRTFARELAQINPLAAQVAMGHVGLGFQMMAYHYLDVEVLLSEALGKLPQPGQAVQRSLF